MRFLPVVERELRVTSRSPRFYWLRVAAASIALAIIAWFWLTAAGGSATSAQRAKVIFVTLSGFTFAYCLVVGLFLTADSISEEKREGTLGLLFLTNLKGYDVAFGKLAAHSLRALYSLFAVFPVLTIPLLLGGLVGKEIFRMSLVLALTLIFSLTLGLLVSAVSRHDRKAQFGALALMLFITAGIPAILSFLHHQFSLPIQSVLYALSPGFAFGTAFQAGYLGKEELFWTSVISIHGFSWVAFFLAAVVVRRVWQDRPANVAQGWRRRFRDWKRGAPELRARYRTALLRVNPYYWLTARDRFKPYYVLWFLTAAALFWVFLWYFNGSDMLEPEAFFTCAVILHTAMKFWLAAEAGRQFAEDRRSSALELTLSTPLPVKEILEGQFLGLLRQFGLPFAAILVFDVSGLIIGSRMRIGADSDSVLMWVAMMIVFIMDGVTIAIFGMWLGLVAKRSSRAIAQTLFYVIGLPWLILLALVTYLSLVNYAGMESTAFFVGAYFVVSLAIDIVLFLRASGNLSTRFRDVATQRFDGGK